MNILSKGFLVATLMAFSITANSQYEGLPTEGDNYSVSLPAWGVTAGIEHWALRYASLGIARKHKSIIESRTLSHIHYTDLSFRQFTTDWDTKAVELSHAFVDIVGGGGRISYYWNPEDATIALQPFVAFNYKNLVASFGYNFFVSDMRVPDLLDFSIRLQFFVPVIKPVTREEMLPSN
ncbi:hypothetical protein [Halocola ammonii]